MEVIQQLIETSGLYNLTIQKYHYVNYRLRVSISRN